MEIFIQSLVDQIVRWLPQLVVGILVFMAFWITAEGVSKIIQQVREKSRIDQHVLSLLAKTTKLVIIIFGVITALGTLGINVSALVAGLGLTGFALGFALKDTISNLLAGVLILIYHPFNINDRIKVASYEGKVISIDLRYTELEGEESIVLIPNSKLFTEPIIIFKT